MLTIEVISDSTKKTLTLPPISSFAYYVNILYTCGIAMLVEKNHPKRYSYPGKIYLNSSDTNSRYFHYSQENKKGAVYLHLALPHMNSFYMKPPGETGKSNTGFWGASVGIDYYHNKNQYFSFTLNSVTDLFTPMPAAVEYSGEYEFTKANFISISNNHQIRSFRIGYGFSFSRNSWDFVYFNSFNPPPPTRIPVKKTWTTAGFVFPFHYHFNDEFFAGLIYQPTIINFSKPVSFQYEHLISIDFGWKIKLYKPKE
jgi:hypothetical protein